MSNAIKFWALSVVLLFAASGIYNLGYKEGKIEGLLEATAECVTQRK